MHAVAASSCSYRNGLSPSAGRRPRRIGGDRSWRRMRRETSPTGRSRWSRRRMRPVARCHLRRRAAAWSRRGRSAPARSGTVSEVDGRLPAASTPGRSSSSARAMRRTSSSGLNVFPTRIPVQAGDRLGLSRWRGKPALLRNGDTGDTPGLFRVASGSARPTRLRRRRQSARAADLRDRARPRRRRLRRRDAGRVPAERRLPGALPDDHARRFPIVLKRSVLLLVSASESASVEVFGQVGWRPRHKGGALVSKTTSRRPRSARA